MARRKHFSGILIGWCLLLLVPMACAANPQDSGRSVYMVRGGQDYIVTSGSRTSSLEVVESSFSTPGGLVWKVTPGKNGDLEVLSTFSMEMPAGLPSFGFSHQWVLVPSKDIPGDYDLSLVVRCATSTVRSGILPGSEDDEYSTSTVLIGSYWHLCKDPGVLEYYHRVSRFDGVEERYDLAVESSPGNKYPTEKDETTFILNLARDIVARNPGDLLVRALYLDALIRARDWETLKGKLKEWEDGFEKSSIPLIRELAFIARDNLKTAQLDAAGQNGYVFIRDLMGRSYDLSSKIRRIPEALSYRQFHVPRGITRGSVANENFLRYQVGVKVLGNVAILDLFQGKRNESLRILCGCYQMGTLMENSGWPMTELIGTAVRDIAVSGLRIHVLNGCEASDEIAGVFRALLELAEKYRQAQEARSDPYESNEIDRNLGLKVMESAADATEKRVRRGVADARFNGLLGAAAARYSVVTRGRFPENLQEWGPLLRDGLPNDPFTSAPLAWISQGKDQMIVYSFGPDSADNKAAIIYDPTNGTVSAGDVVTTIPRVREFPFPRQAARAATFGELLMQFPNGLPSDNFADRKAEGLKATQSVPIRVFSVGPDTDSSSEEKQNPDFVPTTQYDPTNGVISIGDIFTVLRP
ncbi:MAG: hypothetical protein K1X53_17160 [Candidatus Sumerlaeaceae bacterium]|nr:hypothetical protein [Candidatus Sumerlaeaceae bacterium]